MIAACISVVMVQLSFLLVGNQFFNESLLSSAIQSALVVIISIWFRSIKKANEEVGYAGNNNRNNEANDTVPQPSDSEWMFRILR